MKLRLTLQHGSHSGEHELEFSALPDGAAGALRFVLNGSATEAEWAVVTPGVYSILMGGRSYEARVATQPGEAAGEVVRLVTVGTRHYRVVVRDPRRRRSSASATARDGPQEIRAPMPGKIVKVLVNEGQSVTPGAGLLVIEAMKMQNELRAPRAGRVEKIHVAEGTGVETGAHLVKLV
ncbi:MAG: biotin/lipoyl-containing protein [Terriglobia bacterium]